LLVTNKDNLPRIPWQLKTGNWQLLEALMRIVNLKMFRWLACVALCVVCIAAEPDHPYTGLFKNQQISMSLTSQGDGYLGQIDQGLNTYRLSGQPKDGKLVGSFLNSDGNSFPFTATLSGDRLNLTTGSTSYELIRDRAALNPLAIESHNPFSDPTSRPTTQSAPGQSALTQSVMGIGVQFENTNGKFVVANLMSKSPAAEVGLQVGDLLLEIDGTAPGPLENPADRIRQGTAVPVRLAVQRNGKRLEFTVKRQPMNFSTWSAIDSVHSRRAT
jgi:hypothetical protein